MILPFLTQKVMHAWQAISICCKSSAYEQTKLVKCFQSYHFSPQAWTKQISNYVFFNQFSIIQLTVKNKLKKKMFTMLNTPTDIKFELQHDKTNKTTCAPREDIGQPGHPPCLIGLCCPPEEHSLISLCCPPEEPSLISLCCPPEQPSLVSLCCPPEEPVWSVFAVCLKSPVWSVFAVRLKSTVWSVFAVRLKSTVWSVFAVRLKSPVWSVFAVHLNSPVWSVFAVRLKSQSDQCLLSAWRAQSDQSIHLKKVCVLSYP